MSRVAFTKRAKRDLGEIYEHIAKDNIAAAERHRQRLQRRWQMLVDQPRIGTKRDEIRPDLRSVSEGNYVIFYRILGDGTQVVRVLHGSRDPERVFAESDK